MKEMIQKERKRVNPKVYIISRLGRVNKQNKILHLNCLEETSVVSQVEKAVKDFGMRDNQNQTQ